MRGWPHKGFLNESFSDKIWDILTNVSHFVLSYSIVDNSLSRACVVWVWAVHDVHFIYDDVHLDLALVLCVVQFDQVRRMMTTTLLDATENDIATVAAEVLTECRNPKSKR